MAHPNPELAAALVYHAEREARRNYHGDSASIGNLQPLLAHFEGEGLHIEELNTDWSGAFVYRCAVLAGSGLPPRYPDPRVHDCFAYATAWAEYARLPKIRRWHSPAEEPEPGDLIFFKLSEEKPLLMGVLLSLGEGKMELALGDYHNHSAVIERDYAEVTYGWMRLDR